MKNLLTLLAASFLSLASASLFAQNYYVCDTGDDSNNGLSETTPFRSYEKAITTFNKISAGDSVLFCRGGVFPITKEKAISNMSCTTTSECTLADYGDAATERPIISSSGASAMWFTDGGVNSPDGGYVIKNLILMSSVKKGSGVFFYRGVHDVTLDNLHVEGFKVGVTVADGTPARITLKNSVIIKNARQGWLGGCDDCLIENNYFENNGYGVFDHNIYLGSPGKTKPVINMTVRGNTLYKSSMVDGKCEGVSLVAHGRIDNLLIENNIIKEDVGAVTNFCYGISIDPGHSYEEAFHNVVIRGNKILNVGGNGIGCASCDGAIIEDNTIIDEGSVLVHGISVPVRAEDSVKSKNVVIKNNTIVLGKNSYQTSGVRVGGVNPSVVKNNTISLPDYSQGLCVRTNGASANIDTSSNTCKNHTSVTVIDKTIEEPTKIALASTESGTPTTSTASTNTEPASTELTSTASTSTEPTSTATTSTASTSTASTSTEPTSTEPTSTASASTEPASTATTTSTVSTITALTSTELPGTTSNDSQSSIKVVSLGNYKSSRGRSGGGVGFKAKCRAEAADGRCLLQ